MKTTPSPDIFGRDLEKITGLRAEIKKSNMLCLMKINNLKSLISMQNAIWTILYYVIKGDKKSLTQQHRYCLTGVVRGVDMNKRR